MSEGEDGAEPAEPGGEPAEPGAERDEPGETTGFGETMGSEDATPTGETSASGDANAPGEVSPESGAGGPRKLHPLTIPYQIAQQGIGIVAFLFFVAVPGLTAFEGILGGLAGIGVVVIVAALFVGYFVAYYQRFEYELTADTFDIRSGVFSRREREIPLRRIQNVDISQSVVQRVLGIAEVDLETAGGGETEAQLQYVGEEEANRLQSEVSLLRRTGPDAASADAAEPADRVFEITERELGVLALVSTDFRIVSLLFFGGSIFAPSLFTEFEDPIWVSPESLLGELFGPIAGILTVVVVALVAGLFNAARYYGFTLDRGDEELRYQRGLLQKYSGTIPLPKVQTITIRENVLARRLGYAALYIETAGQATGTGESGGSQSAIPLAERDRVHELARTIEPANLDEFERPPKRARQRYAARYALVLLGLTAVLYPVSEALDFFPFWYLPLAGLVLVPAAAHLAWKNRGYAVGEDHVVTRNGFWTRRTKVVPYHRVQTTDSSETIFQRRRDLGTVVVDTAASRSFGGDDAKAVDVDVATADDVRETVPDRLYEALAERKRERSRDRLERLEGDLGSPGGGSTGD